MNIKEQGRSEPSASRALEVIFGLTHSERKTYETIVEIDDPMTVTEIAARVGCAESSAYRYIDTLEENGLVRCVTDEYESTGRSAFVANPPEVVADRMEQEVADIFGHCQQAVEDCRSTFEGTSSLS
ncbi:helix-turn-helix domain-containing protein [Halorhabdus salina]|uniref:helix-turn-helix domain-containing protein n=1 Tax=Halorhabdus salina TaxID=2750670 RepID=UPI002867D9D1|nr:helix-turn-helix domain-containing protein [Halorhabdus salina]